MVQPQNNFYDTLKWIALVVLVLIGFAFWWTRTSPLEVCCPVYSMKCPGEHQVFYNYCLDCTTPKGNRCGLGVCNVNGCNCTGGCRPLMKDAYVVNYINRRANYDEDNILGWFV